MPWTQWHVVRHNAQGISLCQNHQADHALQNAEEHHMGHAGIWLGACGTSELPIAEPRSCPTLSMRPATSCLHSELPLLSLLLDALSLVSTSRAADSAWVQHCEA